MSEQERKAKAKTVFWWTYGLTIVFVALASDAIGYWLFRKSLGSAFVVPAMILGNYVGKFICRKTGLSAEEQKVAPTVRVEKKELSSVSELSFEIRSTPADEGITLLSAATLVFFAVVCTAGLVIFPPRHLSDIFPALLMISMSVSFVCIAVYLFKTLRKGHLIASINDQQLSTSILGFRTSILWEKINAYQIIDAKGIWGQDTSRVQFLDADGRLLITVWCVSMKPEDKAAFLNYINQRFALETNRVLD